MENAEICRRFCKDFKGFSGGIQDDTSKIYDFFGGRFEHIAIQCDIVFNKEKFILRSAVRIVFADRGRRRLRRIYCGS